MDLWAKRKFKAEIHAFSAHVAAQLTKFHRECTLAKLDLDMQSAFKKVVERQEAPLYLEEAEIKVSSEIEIEWFIDAKDLEIINREDRSVILQ